MKPLPPVKRMMPVAPKMPVVPDELNRPPQPVRPVRPVRRVLPAAPVVPNVPDELTQPMKPFSYYDDTQPEMVEEQDEVLYDFPGWDEQPRLARKRRGFKLIRFLLLEGIALAVLLVSTKLEVNEQFSENSLILVYKVLMFVSGICVVLIPVIFYGLPPRLPPRGR
ncbi:MAG: hypothetical protein ABI925_12215 [Verrucomicrobiota bacterium]